MITEEDNPDLKVTEVMKEIGKLWKELDKDGKKAKKYQTAYEKDQKEVCTAIPSMFISTFLSHSEGWRLSVISILYSECCM